MPAKNAKYKYDRKTLNLNKELAYMEEAFVRLSREKSVETGYAFIKLSRLRGTDNDREFGIHEIYVVKEIDGEN